MLNNICFCSFQLLIPEKSSCPQSIVTDMSHLGHCSFAVTEIGMLS